MSKAEGRKLVADEVLDVLARKACRGDGSSAAQDAAKLIGEHLAVALEPENRTLMEAVARAGCLRRRCARLRATAAPKPDPDGPVPGWQTFAGEAENGPKPAARRPDRYQNRR